MLYTPLVHGYKVFCYDAQQHRLVFSFFSYAYFTLRLVAQLFACSQVHVVMAITGGLYSSWLRT